MGQDKATLLFNSKSLLDNSVTLLRRAGASEVLVSRNSNSKNPAYISDIYPNKGPLGGIYSALMASPLDVLISAVDMPLLTPAQLINLANAATLQANDMNAWQLNNEPLPVYIKNTQAVKQQLSAILLNKHGGKSIKYFLHTIGVQSVICNETHTLINTNTPQQFNDVLASPLV
ncbi:molybdenum cofactor guanylyltransferase [Pseudoalteromonas sp. MMG010]|nr:molybdenum cofactor guanylyltransferase [Pseudoalteromonas sp. MMG010]